MHLTLLTTHRSDWPELLAAQDMLSAEEQQRAVQYKMEDDRTRFIVGRVLVRRQLDNPQSVIAVDANGKPYLAEMPNLHFNMSHSGDWVLVVFAHRPVGVDVQAIHSKPVDRENVARHAFHPQEQEYIRVFPQKAEELFYRIWCAREAILKASGQGVFASPPLFSVVPLLAGVWGEADGMLVKTSKIDDNHYFSVAVNQCGESA